MSTLDEEVMTLAAAMAPVDCEPHLDDTFFGELGYTSLRFLELTIVIERAFGLAPLTPESLAGVRSVGDLVGLIRTQQGRS